TLIVFILFPWMLDAQTCGEIICTPKKVCFGSSEPVFLNLCTPLGGVYSGSVFVDPIENQFQVSQAPAGDYVLTYTVNNETCHVTLTVVAYPTIESISGDVKVCKGDTGTFYANGVNNAESYIWSFNSINDTTYIPQLVLPISTNLVPVSLPLTVKGISFCGEGSSSPAFPITLINKPKPVIDGKISVCKNEQANYIAPNGYASYKWSVAASDGTISGYDTSKIVKVAWSNKDISTLKLRVWTSEGCFGDTTLNVTKGAGTAPDPSEIWQFGYNLFVCSDSTSGITYQWYNNNVAKSTLSYYYCPDSDIQGEIYVKTTNGSCSSESAKIKASKTPGGLKANSVDTKFSVFPNPVSDKLIIRCLIPITEMFTYQLLDIYGKQQFMGNASGLETGIDVSGLASGIYFIRIDNMLTGTETYKIIKTK
ncbi:MAG: T9SS type A sorting domain-containing protein, partial [Bacteroidales bacterium]